MIVSLKNRVNFFAAVSVFLEQMTSNSRFFPFPSASLSLSPIPSLFRKLPKSLYTPYSADHPTAIQQFPVCHQFCTQPPPRLSMHFHLPAANNSPEYAHLLPPHPLPLNIIYPPEQFAPPAIPVLCRHVPRAPKALPSISNCLMIFAP